MSLTADEFAALTNVSRETMERLRLYHDRLIHWNRAINLVSKSTLSDAWQRHFLDSAQIYPQVPKSARTLIDLGSGAGFAGMVLAIMGADHLQVTLVEVDKRKAAFLADVSRETGVKVSIKSQRIETLPPAPYDVISARALASLDQLCGFAARFWHDQSVALFLKGKTANEELTQARKAWKITADMIPSQTDNEAHLIRLTSLSELRGS